MCPVTLLPMFPVHTLAPRYQHQAEIAFLRGSKFRIVAEDQAETRLGRAPAFFLEETE